MRRAFALARSASPCILFFDEIDTIVGSSNNHGGMERGKNAEGKHLVFVSHYVLRNEGLILVSCYSACIEHILE